MAIRLPQRGWLFDLDGTVYLGEALIPGAAQAIAALRADGRRVAFLSNKPLYTRGDYADKLTRLGVPTREDEVVNSSIVLARHLQRLDPGAPVFVIGEPPLIGELRAHGFEVRSDGEVRWVVIAFDRTFDYAKLNTALQAVRRHDARLIATNPDRTCPTAEGEIPDCAGMMAAVEAVTGKTVEVVVGTNFTFGHRAAGTLERLPALGGPYGLSAEGVDLLRIDGRTVSSSSIREALAAGDLSWPVTALGRRFVLDGDVVSGHGRGRGLGFPTANLRTWPRLLLPGQGIYAGIAETDGERHLAAIDVGTNPTFGVDPLHVEAFLLDYEGGDLHGHTLAAEFWARLRDEVRFDSVEELAAAIGLDVERTREIVSL